MVFAKGLTDVMVIPDRKRRPAQSPMMGPSPMKERP